MFKTDQLGSIIKEKNAAFKILINTQNKLRKSCDKALKFINTNSDDIVKKVNEIDTLKDSNRSLTDQIAMMNASIDQTESIINPVVSEVSEDK